MRRAGVVALLSVALVVTGCTASEDGPSPEATTSSEGALRGGLDDAAVAAALGDLARTGGSALPTPHLAEGLAAPTNRWFGALALQEDPFPVFALPLSFLPTATGFELGAPRPVTSAAAIVGPHLPAVVVDAGADDWSVTAYDEVSVTVSLLDDGEELGTVVLAQGSPAAGLTASRPLVLGLGPGTWSPAADGVWTTTDALGVRFALVTDGELTAGEPTAGASTTGELVLTEGGTAVWLPLPEGADAAEIAPLAASPLRAVDVDAQGTTTVLGYRAADGGGTLVVTRPHQRVDLQDGLRCDLGRYPSVYGELELCAGTELRWGSPAVEPGTGLDLDGISDAEREELLAALRLDAEPESALPADTYYGGKALQRLGQLIEVADALGEQELAATITARLVDELAGWTDGTGCRDRTERCFAYDEAVPGVVGQAISFGSEQFNDHHFHYGYFLVAAAIAARHDPEAVPRIRPVIDLLAADVAGAGGDSFPVRRVFDPYAGHSWASGPVPFADGNNQESISEAVNAWNGLALWASATEQPQLEAQARWLLAAESASGRAYWTGFDASDPVYAGFDASIVSLNWGAKRDWATWFSAEPSAMLGILLLPMTSASEPLGDDPARVRANLAEASGGSADAPFQDYLLMYRSLLGGDDARAALEAARTLPAQRIDDGNSRSHLLAWVLAHR